MHQGGLAFSVTRPACLDLSGVLAPASLLQGIPGVCPYRISTPSFPSAFIGPLSHRSEHLRYLLFLSFLRITCVLSRVTLLLYLILFVLHRKKILVSLLRTQRAIGPCPSLVVVFLGRLYFTTSLLGALLRKDPRLSRTRFFSLIF